MGMLDGLLSQVAENVDLKNLAETVGLSESQVETAISALAKAHGESGDTVASAAESTGFSTESLSGIVEAIGGEGSLGRFSEMLGGGEGGGLGGIASGLFGKN